MQTSSNINEVWNTALINTYQLPSQFHFSTPCPLVQKSNIELWQRLNFLPEESSTPLTLFHEIALLSQKMVAPQLLKNSIGEHYFILWNTYLNEQNITPKPKDILIIFRDWAIRNCIGQLNQGMAAIYQESLYYEYQNIVESYLHDGSPADFDGNYDDLAQSLQQTSFSTIQLSTHYQLNNKTIIPLLFSSSINQAIARKFFLHEIDIQCCFGKLINWTITPGKWYNSSILQNALRNPSLLEKTDTNPIDWEYFFGENGTLKYLSSSVVAVDQINFKLTTPTKYTPEEQNYITQNIDKGFWPFYLKSSETTSNTVHFTPKKTIFQLNTDSIPILIGSVELKIEEYLGAKQEEINI